MYGQGERGGERTGVLTPSELEPTIVKCQSLIGRGMEECKSRGRVDERYKLMYKSGKLTAIPKELQQKKRTAMCLSCMYRMLCSTPPLMALQRSSVVVSG